MSKIENLRILFLSNADEINPVISGAGIRHVNVLSSLQTNYSAEILIIDNDMFLRSQFQSYLSQKGVKYSVKTFPYLHFFSFKLRLIYDLLASTLLAVRSANGFNVISADYAPGLFFTATLIKLLTGKKLIVYIQILNLHHETITSRIMKYFLKYADTVLVANSKYINYVKHRNIHETFHAISSDFKILPGLPKKFDLCFIGTVEDNRKGICEYIQVAEKLFSESCIKSALIITHTRPGLLNFMYSQIHHPGLFVLKQGIDQKTVNICLNQSKIFLFPTQSESFGLVIGEALKTGTPAIISEIPELDIWHDIAYPSHDYFQTTKGVLQNYINIRNKLLLILRQNNLLKKTWADVAKLEAGYMFD